MLNKEAVMIKPINVGETFEYVLKMEKNDSDPTVFILSILDSIIKTKLKDLGMVYRYNPDAPKDSVAEAKMNIAEQELEFVRFGLKGIKNFMDKNGNEIKFKMINRRIGNTDYEIVSDETLKVIPRFAINEIANELMQKNEISEEEEKN